MSIKRCYSTLLKQLPLYNVVSKPNSCDINKLALKQSVKNSKQLFVAYKLPVVPYLCLVLREGGQKKR